MKTRKKINYFKIEIFLFILGVIIITCFLFFTFNKKASPKLSHVANLEFTKVINKIASDYHSLLDIPFDNLFTVTLNDKKEILTVDYKMEEIYEIIRLNIINIRKNN